MKVRKVTCPDCNEQAAQAGKVDVPGIGTCNKYVCPECDMAFYIPEQSHRVPDSVSSDGTTQGNAKRAAALVAAVSAAAATSTIAGLRRMGWR